MVNGTSCGLCNRSRAAGFAVLGGKRYCIGLRRPNCFELAQEVRIMDDGTTLRFFALVPVDLGMADPLFLPDLDLQGAAV